MIKEDFLKRIRSAFDLNIYEAKIWLALLSKGVATAGELSDMSDVPRSRSYDVLESLEKRGFIIMKLGRPIKYIAVKPDEVMKRVKKSIIDRAEIHVKMLENVESVSVYKELDLLFKHGIENIDPSNVSGAFKGRGSIYDHMSTMLENAQKEIIIATTPEGIVRKLENFKPLFRKLNQKGVSIRIAVPLRSEKAKESAKELKEYAKIKDLNLNARFVLVDGKSLMFMLADDKNMHDSVDAGIWVNSEFFTSAMNSLFSNAWGRA